jgi:predicted ATPase
MKKVVLTGGPCSGKTTTLNAIREEFGGQVMVVPEAATILLSGGFPVPGKDCQWSKEWQAAFQTAIATLQQSMEKSYELVAREKGICLLICDRGLFDGAAYTPGGTEEFCRLYKVDEKKTLAEYEAVLHLESLATADPSKYGKAGNENRFENLEEARALETKTRQSWSKHSRQLVITGGRGIDGKISEVVGIIRFLLTT